MAFDEYFGDFEGFNSQFMRRIRKVMEQIDKAAKTGDLKGKWQIEEIDRPGVKGYIIQGRFGSDQPSSPLHPFDPFEPWNPERRRPVPNRRFQLPKDSLRESHEPLTDVFEEEETIKIYVEVPGEEKKDIQLNVTEGRVEIKGKKFYKMIDLPTRNIDMEKASSKYKNGVLQVTIPKKNETPEKDVRKIEIE